MYVTIIFVMMHDHVFFNGCNSFLCLLKLYGELFMIRRNACVAIDIYQIFMEISGCKTHFEEHVMYDCELLAPDEFCEV